MAPVNAPFSCPNNSLSSTADRIRALHRSDEGHRVQLADRGQFSQRQLFRFARGIHPERGAGAVWLADALIHELLHNRLFFIIERGEGAEPSEFYSPWRDDSNDGNLYALTDGRRGSITEKWSVCTCQSRDPLAGDRRRRHDLQRTDQ